MVLNKRAIVGKIILGILIAIVLFLIYVGMSIYQIYSSVGIVKDEILVIKGTAQEVLDTRDCEKVSVIYDSKDKIFKEFDSACSNPLLRYSIGKISVLPTKCDTLDEFRVNITADIVNFEELCIDSRATNKTGNFSEIDFSKLDSMDNL